MKLSVQCFVHFINNTKEVPIEKLTEVQKEYMINHGTVAFMREVGIEVNKKGKGK